MSMRSDSGAEVPDLTRDVARAAFPKGCLAMRIRDGLGPLFSDEDFKAAFGVRGRPRDLARPAGPGQRLAVPREPD